MSSSAPPLAIHPIAEIFPPMGDEEFEEFKADIEANGLREPIWHYQGRIIDGRNRFRACAELGITPAYREWDGQGCTLLEFVVSQNLHRRHLSAGQKAAVALEIEEYLAREAKRRQRLAGGDRGNQHTKRKRQKQEQEQETPDADREAFAVRPPAEEPATEASPPVVESFPQPASEPDPPAPKSRDSAARAVGANPRYVQDAKKLAREAPDLLEKVKADELTIPEAKRQLKGRTPSGSPPSVSRASLRPRPPGDALRRAWLRASDDDRRAFAREFAAELIPCLPSSASSSNDATH